MNIDEEREKIGKFVKAGLFGLSFVLLVGCGILYIPKAIATFKPVAEVEKQPISSVECADKKVALTFDVAGTDDDVEEILTILGNHSVKASFFMTGEWVEEHSSSVKNIYQAGHDLGNCSENHKEMTLLSKEECQQEIALVHDKVKEITGVDMILFRAPYGAYNNTLIEAAETMSYYPIEWNVDSLDWKDYGIDSIVNEICNNQKLKNGSIILCHSGTKFTKGALDEVITVLQVKGYSFVGISEMLYKSDYYIDENGRQIASLAQ